MEDVLGRAASGSAGGIARSLRSEVAAVQISENAIAPYHRRLERCVPRVDGLSSLEEKDVGAWAVIRVERGDGDAARVRNHEGYLVGYWVLGVSRNSARNSRPSVARRRA